MKKDEIINYWVASSSKDLKAMGSLFKNGHYVWALFLGHLILEKIIKSSSFARSIKILASFITIFIAQKLY